MATFSFDLTVHSHFLISNTSSGTITAQVEGGTPPYQYQWSGYPNEVENSLDNLEPGTYQLIVTDDRGCMISDSATIELSTAASETELHNDIMVYPNPTSGNFRIQTSSFDRLQIEGIYDSSFKRINVDIIESEWGEQEISLEQYAPGIYFIVLQYKYQRVIRKISIIR